MVKKNPIRHGHTRHPYVQLLHLMAAGKKDNGNALPALLGGKPTRRRENFLVFGAPQIENEDIEEVVDSLRRRWLGTGPKVKRFESDFAQYKHMPHAVAVNSCTAALHLSILALGIGPGDEVITTPMTFCATVNAILHAGAVPVLADCDPLTLNLSPRAVAEKITPRTKAIVPVHFAGRLCDMEGIMALAKRHRLRVIEDCAHAIETSGNGQGAGTFGDIGCFSFYATKNLTTGEGGMICTSDAQLADKIKRLALHGMTQDAWRRFSDSGYVHYDVVDLGYKYNMTDLQAALGLHQLGRLDANWEKRRSVWNRYQAAFASLSCTLPQEPAADEKHAYHLYTVQVSAEPGAGSPNGKARDWVLEAMTAENIGVGVHYRSICDHPYYQNRFGWRSGDYPHAASIGNSTISLPLSAALEEKDIEDVIYAFTKVMVSAKDATGETSV